MDELLALVNDGSASQDMDVSLDLYSSAVEFSIVVVLFIVLSITLRLVKYFSDKYETTIDLLQSTGFLIWGGVLTLGSSLIALCLKQSIPESFMDSSYKESGNLFLLFFIYFLYYALCFVTSYKIFEKINEFCNFHEIGRFQKWVVDSIAYSILAYVFIQLCEIFLPAFL